MPKLHEMLTSKFLRKEDVPQPVIVTIAKVTQEVVDNDSGELKWTMYFQEFDKGMALNSTNLQIAFAVTGVDDSDDMKGHEIIVYNDPSVTYMGKVTGGLRLRGVEKPPQPARPARAPKPVSAGVGEMENDVPWHD